MSRDSSRSNETDPVEVTGEGDLKNRVETNERVLVDFYATWCGPCKMMEPTIEEIAEKGSSPVLKVDVDEHPELASNFEVRAVPTVLIFEDGSPSTRFVGHQDKRTLERALAD